MSEAPALPLLPPPGYAGPVWSRQPAAMDDFLAAVEGRAFAIALSLLRDREEALDAVQDAMLRLVRKQPQSEGGLGAPVLPYTQQSHQRQLSAPQTPGALARTDRPGGQ